MEIARTGMKTLLLIGLIIYTSCSKSRDKNFIQDNSTTNTNVIDTVSNELTYDEMLKAARAAGPGQVAASSTTIDLTTEEGVKELKQSILDRGLVDPEYDVSKYLSAIPENSRKAKFCKKYTEESKLYSGMEKSLFDYDANTIIQKMYISDLAGGYGEKYRLIAKEAKEEGYIDAMASGMIIEYRKQGVLEMLDNQGFTEFQLYLIYEDGTVIVSKKYSIY